MSRTISMASGAILVSVYRWAAAPSLPGEPKLPWPSASGYRSDHGWTRRTSASYTDESPCGWNCPITSPMMRVHFENARSGR
jgi:hypothetical protein